MVESVGLKNLKAETARKIIEYIDNDIQNINIEGIMEIISKEKRGENNKMTNEKQFETREQKVENYISLHPGISYREAVLKSGVTGREDYLAPDEAVRIAGLLDGGISSIDLTKGLSVFSEATRKKLNGAHRILTDAKKELELIAEKPLEK